MGDINIAAISLNNATSSLTIQAAHNIVLSSPTSSSVTVTATGTMSLTAGGAISMPLTSQLVAANLSLTAHDGIGAAGQPIFTKVDSLTANSAAGNGDEFITQQSKGLTA